MNDEQKSFETVSLPLAASILTLVPGAQYSHITPEAAVDGRRIITLTYPADQTQAVQNVVEQFHSRRLTIPLYVFNRCFNTLRDYLLRGKGCPHEIRRVVP